MREYLKDVWNWVELGDGFWPAFARGVTGTLMIVGIVAFVAGVFGGVMKVFEYSSAAGLIALVLAIAVGAGIIAGMEEI
jgi:hypothetical protein